MAPQARVITELNPLIVGWTTYYTGIVEATIMSHYDDLIEQQLMNWASRRHPGKAQDWLLASLLATERNNRKEPLRLLMESNYAHTGKRAS